MSSPPYVQSGISPLADPTQPYDACNKRYVDQLTAAYPLWQFTQWRFLSTAGTTSRVHYGSHVWFSNDLFSNGSTQNVLGWKLGFDLDILEMAWSWNGSSAGNKRFQLRIHNLSDNDDPYFGNEVNSGTWTEEKPSNPITLDGAKNYWVGVTAPRGVNSGGYTFNVRFKLEYNFD